MVFKPYRIAVHKMIFYRSLQKWLYKTAGHKLINADVFFFCALLVGNSFSKTLKGSMIYDPKKKS